MRSRSPLSFAAAAAGVLILAAPTAVIAAKHAAPTVHIGDLAKMQGPTPPKDAKHIGKQAQPMLGQMALPIKDVDVYQMDVTDPAGQKVKLNWAYKGTQTYMWATGPIDCGNGQFDKKAGFVMEIKGDGSGSYMLGQNQCQTPAAYGCAFNNMHAETGCGACTWNDVELSCVTAR